MADLLDDDVDEEIGQDFDPASLPLGTFAAFDVSDQPMWTTAENAENRLNDDQKNAIKALPRELIQLAGAWKCRPHGS
jgi:hypothetical protein